MFKDLIEYKDLNEASEDMFGFDQVTFKRDFGPWKAGDKADNLWFLTDGAIVQEFDANGALMKICSFRLVALDS